MKCPHCEYASGYEWNEETRKSEELPAIKGEFYELSNEITVERSTNKGYGRSNETATVYACPSCGKLFIDVS